MRTLHCTLENGADLYVNERHKIDTIALGLLKKEEEEEEECQIAIFYFARCVRKIALYSDVIHSFDWKSAMFKISDSVPSTIYSSVSNVLHL